MKRPLQAKDRGRLRRQAYCRDLFTGTELFLAGIPMVAAFLLNPSAAGRLCQFLIFSLFAWLNGRKINFLIALLVIGGIVFFNLLVPHGRVLFQLGPFRISEGALLSGLYKGISLEGLIMLSRAVIRSDLRLPTSFGSLMAESFLVFEHITERGNHIKGRDIIGGIDTLMLAISAELKEGGTEASAGPPVQQGKKKTRYRGIIILCAAAALSWLPLIAVLVNRLS